MWIYISLDTFLCRYVTSWSLKAFRSAALSLAMTFLSSAAVLACRTALISSLRVRTSLQLIDQNRELKTPVDKQACKADLKREDIFISQQLLCARLGQIKQQPSLSLKYWTACQILWQCETSQCWIYRTGTCVGLDASKPTVATLQRSLCSARAHHICNYIAGENPSFVLIAM